MITCNICGEVCKDVYIDGKTKWGPWAIMCKECHVTHGFGFGTGRGQMFDAKTKEKVKG